MFIKKIFLFISILTIFFSSTINAQEKRTIMLMKLKYGDVKIELFDDLAPNHLKRIKSLADQGKYDGVAFHRVIDGFMAQTGDVQFGNTKDQGEVKANYNEQRAGTGGSKFPNLKAEFNNLPHVRGTLSMARAQDPDSANSQFFICFDSQPSLDRQYTVFGRVISGMEFVDKIKKGVPGSGAVSNPDIIISFKSIKN